MTTSQRAATIWHHEKMARAFDSCGQEENAQSARRLAEELKAWDGSGEPHPWLK